MPIGGVVISIRPGDLEAAKNQLASYSGVEIHGADDQGNIVAVLDTVSSEEMERLMQFINANPLILHVGLTYLNMEDVLGESAQEALHAKGKREED
jgi:nitrate reductase NapAB chaperone NapD